MKHAAITDMGRCHTLAADGLRELLYDFAAHDGAYVSVLDSNPHGDGLHLMELVGNAVPGVGYQGQMCAIVDAAGLRFEKDTYDYWET